MASQAVNMNQIYHGSNEALSKSINVLSAYWAANVSDDTNLGGIVGDSFEHKINACIRLDAGYASGESLVITLKRFSPLGVIQNMVEITLDENTAGAAGQYDIEQDAFLQIKPGDYYIATRVYTPGGGAADPAVTLVVQLY